MIYLLSDVRLKNIFWTVAENYNENPRSPLFAHTNEYTSALEGFIYFNFPSSIINDYISFFLLNSKDKDSLLVLFRILFENILWDDLIKKRPGVLDKRNSYIEEFLKSSHNSKKSHKILRNFYEFKFFNKDFGENEILSEILSFKSYEIMEILTYIHGIFEKYFSINDYMPEIKKPSFKEFIEKSKDVKNLSRSLKNISYINDRDLEKYTIESAEFMGFFDDDLKRTKAEEFKSDINGNSSIYEIAKKHFGREEKVSYVQRRMEEEIASGIHKNIKIFHACGDFENKNSYYAGEMENSYRENLEFYKKNQIVFNRAIKKLSLVIKSSLLRDAVNEDLKSDSGEIIPSEIWRNEFLNDGRVFKKRRKSESKDIFVDILLDSSASQLERKSIVACESYIISKALTDLNIKTRVLYFKNFYNYLVIRKFRDYRDPKFKNKDIFYYNPTGSNRDGFAIKYAHSLIGKNYEARKFLIILSDGKPNDEINLGLVGSGKIDGEDYVNEKALKDTAKEVLLARLDGINTFGVFTGEEKDLEKIKKIYGKDFAYIKDLYRFHDMVGIFLKSYAEKIF